MSDNSKDTYSLSFPKTVDRKDLVNFVNDLRRVRREFSEMLRQRWFLEEENLEFYRKLVYLCERKMLLLKESYLLEIMASYREIIQEEFLEAKKIREEILSNEFWYWEKQKSLLEERQNEFLKQLTKFKEKKNNRKIVFFSSLDKRIKKFSEELEKINSYLLFIEERHEELGALTAQNWQIFEEKKQKKVINAEYLEIPEQMEKPLVSGENSFFAQKINSIILRLKNFIKIYLSFQKKNLAILFREDDGENSLLIKDLSLLFKSKDFSINGETLVMLSRIFQEFIDLSEEASKEDFLSFLTEAKKEVFSLIFYREILEGIEKECAFYLVSDAFEFSPEDKEFLDKLKQHFVQIREFYANPKFRDFFVEENLPKDLYTKIDQVLAKISSMESEIVSIASFSEIQESLLILNWQNFQEFLPSLKEKIAKFSNEKENFWEGSDLMKFLNLKYKLIDAYSNYLIKEEKGEDFLSAKSDFLQILAEFMEKVFLLPKEGDLPRDNFRNLVADYFAKIEAEGGDINQYFLQKSRFYSENFEKNYAVLVLLSFEITLFLNFYPEDFSDLRQELIREVLLLNKRFLADKSLVVS